MKKYDSYKDSGVEWIGEVPSHWDSCRFKNFLNIKSEKSNSSHKVGLENIESQTGRYIATDTEFDGDGVGFQEGDILYGKLRPYLQKVWLSEFDGNAVGDFFVFACKPNSNNVYVKYLMLSDCFTKEADGSTFGAKMPRVASDFILTLPFYLPPVLEQQAIANYLDNKCLKIDNVIATQEKRVELLRELKQSIITRAVTRGINPDVKMKDSGVEWIGEIPEHWEVMPNKRLSRIQTGTTPSTKVPEYFEPEEIKWFTPGDVTDDLVMTSASRFVSNKAKEEGACRIFPPKSIYFVGIGATIGKVGVCDEEASSNQQINALMVNKKANYKYLAYILRCQKDEIYLSANVVTLPIINQEKTGELLSPVPPIEEQEVIVTYIEQQTNKLETSITKALRQIELLKEYKQSLITEVVTGKRKVC